MELELIDPAGEDPEEQIVVVITPDDGEPPATPSVPAKPSPGWSQGSRSDEEEAPASSSQAPAPHSSQPPEREFYSAPEELPAAPAAVEEPTVEVPTVDVTNPSTGAIA